MPPDMPPTAQAFWNTVVEECRFAGVLARVDGKALRLAADSWSIYLEAQDSIHTDGINVKEPTAHGGVRVKANPAVSTRAKAWKEVQTILAKFGLTPADRTGLKAGANVGDEDKRKDIKGILKLHG